MVDIGARTARGTVFTTRARTRGLEGPAGEVVDEEETAGGGGILIRVRDPSPGLFRIPLILPNPLFFRGKLVEVVEMRVTKRRLWLLVAAASFWAVLHFGVIKDENGWDNPANACFAILLFCTILWASEVSLVKHSVDLTRLTRVGHTAIRHLAFCSDVIGHLTRY